MDVTLKQSRHEIETLASLLAPLLWESTGHQGITLTNTKRWNVVVASLLNSMNKHLSGQYIETPWRICNVAVIGYRMNRN